MSKRGGWRRRGVDERAAAGLALRHDDALALLREGQLAVAYLCAERLDEGHALLLDAYKTRQRVLGEYDAATLTAADCLATAHRLLGRHAEAVALGKRVVAARTRTLGRAHVDTLTSRMGLALAYLAAG